MGQANKHHADMEQYMKKRHLSRVNDAASRVSGPALVKKVTGVVVGKNTTAGTPTQAPKYNGQPNTSPNKNQDDRMGRLITPFQKKTEDRKVNKNI